MKFVYEAVDVSGSVISGNIDAVNSSELVRTLESRDLVVTEIRAEEDRGLGVSRKASTQEIILALHEMVTLLESGVSIADTIEAQALARYPLDLQQAYDRVSIEVRKGSSFSDALRLSGMKIPGYFYELASAGELSGDLAGSLRHAVDQFEYDFHTAEDVRSAMIYPIILVGSGIAAVLLIFVFVVPRFLPLIERSDSLPLLSKIVLTSGIWFNDNLWLIAGAGVLMIGAISVAASQERYRQMAYDVMSRAPLFGGWLTEVETAKWSSLMAALLGSRVDLLSALELATKSVRSSSRRNNLSRVISDIKSGETLANALERSQVLTTTGYNLIRAGERAGKMPQMMRSLARLYDETSRQRLKRLLAMIEPAAILIIGVVIGLLVTGVILAITSVNDVAL
jgi:general secretion pathway protein F